MKISRKITHWLLLIISVGLVVTGYGITKYQLVDQLTFGLLNKALSFKLHSWLGIPFIVVLFIHVYLVSRRRK